MVRCSCGGTGSGCSCIVQGGGYNVVTGTGTITDPYIITNQAVVNNQTGTTYTPTLGDVGDYVTMANAAAMTLTLPSDANLAWPIGQEFTLLGLGAGTVTIVAGSGATLTGTGTSAATGVGRRVIKRAANTWFVF